MLYGSLFGDKVCHEIHIVDIIISLNITLRLQQSFIHHNSNLINWSFDDVTAGVYC